jgi:hypothetical protein
MAAAYVGRKKERKEKSSYIFNTGIFITSGGV